MAKALNRLLCSALIAACTAVAPARANNIDQPLKILVGYPAGGGLDTATRALAEQLRQMNAGANIVVENRPGGGSLIAAEVLANAKGDGSILMVAPITVVAVHPFVFKKLSFDPLNDLVPVAYLGEFRYGLAVNNTVAAKNVSEFIPWVKARPKSVSFASLGTGSFAQLLGVLFNRSVGTDMVEVPYKGSAPGLMDLRGGQVQATFDTVASMAEQHRGNAIRLLAVTGNQRSPLLPDVPTFKEAGLNLGDIETSEFWYGVFAPKGTPPAVVARLNAAVNEALRAQQLRTRLETLDITPQAKSVADFTAQTRADHQRWGKLIRESGLRFE
jgi:tripartite-type tricarboxylate transporter receptor subunit TctC